MFTTMTSHATNTKPRDLEDSDARNLPDSQGADLEQYCAKLVQECGFQGLYFFSGRTDCLERAGCAAHSFKQHAALGLWLNEMCSHFREHSQLLEMFGNGATIICGIDREGDPDFAIHFKSIYQSFRGYELAEFVERQMVEMPFRTHFGRGNRGVPKRITKRELAAFVEKSDKARRYLVKFADL